MNKCRAAVYFAALILVLTVMLVRSVNADVVCGETEEALRVQWQRYTNFLQDEIAHNEYLPNSSWQTAILSLLTQKYDEDYWAMLTAQGSSTDALRYTRIALDSGDLEDACLFLRNAVRWIEFIQEMRQQSILDFREGSAATARLYKDVIERGLAPFITGPAAIAINAFSLYLSYSIYRLEDEETLPKEFFIEVGMTALLQLLSLDEIPFERVTRLGEMSRQAYIRGSPELLKQVEKERLSQYIFQVIVNSGQQELTEQVKMHVNLVLDFLYNEVDRLIGTRGAQPPSSFPIRTASSVHPEVVYRHRAVKESGLLQIGLQVLIDPVQSICNRIFTASVDAAWHFRRTVRAAFDPSQLGEALNLSESAATEALGTSTPLLGPTPDPSARLPSRASAAASAWPNPCR